MASEAKGHRFESCRARQPLPRGAGLFDVPAGRLPVSLSAPHAREGYGIGRILDVLGGIGPTPAKGYGLWMQR